MEETKVTRNVGEDQVRQDIGKLVKYKEKLLSSLHPFFSRIGLRQKVGGVVDEKFRAWGNLKKWRGFALRVLVLIFILYLIISLFNLAKDLLFPKVVEKPSPSPQSITHEVDRPSVYATDAAVLEVEEEIGILEKELDKLQLGETRLKPPPLNFDVNFE